MNLQTTSEDTRGSKGMIKIEKVLFDYFFPPIFKTLHEELELCFAFLIPSAAAYALM